MARPRKNPAQEARRRRTIWLLKKVVVMNGNETVLPDGGVRSTIPNCGYTPGELKSITSKGYQLSTEEVAE